MAETIIAREFRMTRDFRSVAWKATLWYNLLRALGAGVVIGVLMIVTGQASFGEALAQALVHPILWLVFGLPIGYVAAKLAGTIPFIGWFAIFMSLIFVAIGDPLVALLHRFVPQAVPAEDPPLFQMNLITFLLKPESATEIAFTRH